METVTVGLRKMALASHEDQNDEDHNDKNPVTFFSLPGEIRNEIYALALIHVENAGIISPLSRRWRNKIRPNDSSSRIAGFKTMVNGRDEIVHYR